MQIKLNGKKIDVNEGQTILQVCRENGIKIPALCSLKKKDPRSVCRLCSVEVNGQKHQLQTSCSTAVSEGMVVKTDTEDIHLTRKLLMRLILKEHGECGLQNCEVEKLAAEMGVSLNETPFKAMEAEVPKSSDFIHINRELCIHCDRCWTACERNVISKVKIDGQFVFKFNRSLNGISDCVYCGDCVKACPAQALSLSKNAARKNSDVTLT